MLNFITVGRNFIVDRFMTAAAEIPEISFYGAYSRNYDTGKEFAEKYGADRVYTSISELCEDDNIDFVYIANPNKFHKEFAVALLKAGKHVLCEKPAATNAEDFEEMLAAASNTDSVLMEAMVPVHSPSMKKIREMLGKIGKVRRATLSFCQYSSRYDKFKNGIVENAFKKELGGGSLMDIGIYPLAFMHCLFGAPFDFVGFADFLKDSIDGQGTVLAKYDGMICELLYSKITDSRLPSEIQGENGNIIIDKMSRPKKVTLILRNGETEEYSLDPEKEDIYYETVDFVRQINGEKMPEFNRMTLDVLKSADIIRNMLGIDFGEKV